MEEIDIEMMGWGATIFLLLMYAFRCWSIDYYLNGPILISSCRVIFLVLVLFSGYNVYQTYHDSEYIPESHKRKFKRTSLGYRYMFPEGEELSTDDMQSTDESDYDDLGNRPQSYDEKYSTDAREMLEYGSSNYDVNEGIIADSRSSASSSIAETEDDLVAFLAPLIAEGIPVEVAEAISNNCDSCLDYYEQKLNLFAE